MADRRVVQVLGPSTGGIRRHVASLTDSLADKDAGFLGYVILNGRRGTAMPPWREHLSEAEAQWIAEQLKKGLKK